MHGTPELNATELERRRQIEAARAMKDDGDGQRRILSLNRSTGGTPPMPRVSPPRKQNVLTGHQAFLKSLEKSGADMVVEKLNGVIYYGKIRHSDKFSITLYVTDILEPNSPSPLPAKPTPRDRVIFKHDISEFYTTTPPAPVPDHRTEEGHAV